MPHGFGLEVHNVLHPAESRDFLANEPARNKTNILNIKSFEIMATELITNDWLEMIIHLTIKIKI